MCSHPILRTVVVLYSTVQAGELRMSSNATVSNLTNGSNRQENVFGAEAMTTHILLRTVLTCRGSSGKNIYCMTTHPILRKVLTGRKIHLGKIEFYGITTHPILRTERKSAWKL